jgi:2-methylisocitrate lyase-like PEP mutase family enzyme
MTNTIKLRNRLKDQRILVAPGVADTLSAVLAQNAGFEAIFLSGSAMSFTHLGRPDIGLLSLAEIAAITARIAERVDIPIFVDADSGFGSAYHVYRSIRALELAGASCIQIEDQIHDQHPDEIGKRPVIPLSDMLAKLRAALDARRSDATLISARSDAVFSESVASAMERALAYIDVGADIVFVEGLSKANDRKQLVKFVNDRAAILFNTALPTGDKAPDAATLQTEGYSIALSPATVIAATFKASELALSKLASETPGLSAKTSETPPLSHSVVEAIRGGDFIEQYEKWSKSE